MEASGPSDKNSVPPKPGVAQIIGTAIAVLTLTIPMMTIAYFSANQSTRTILPETYSLPSLNK